MVMLQRNNMLLKMPVFIRFLIALFFLFVCSSVDAANIDNSKEKEMPCNNQESIFQAISSATKIISRESTIEEQADKYKVFFDEAKPHYPKNGPVVRYILSHKREIGIDFLKDNESSDWNSAYISLSSVPEYNRCYGLDLIGKAQLTYTGKYEKEGVYLNQAGERVVYKFNVLRYSYKNGVIVDFKVNNDVPSGGGYPINFINIQVYINK